MTIPNSKEIEVILGKILFPDGTTMLERASTTIIKNNNIAFTVDISGYNRETGENLQHSAKNQLNAKYPQANINIVITSSKKPSDDAIQHKNAKDAKAKIHLDGVNKVIAITAGKGGVGKSTITSLLAHKLRREGKKVGILDADIYGPSIPRIFNVNNKPELDNKKMVPLESYGIKLNSIGFITAEGASISWRGPMTSKALYQLISLTKWGNLDYLLIDMPPGTGDIHISLLENYFISGAIIVTTPQKISEIDVLRSANLYQKLGAQILGVVENMSYLSDPTTGKEIKIFNGNSGKDIATQCNTSLLATIPITPKLAAEMDNGNDLSYFSNLVANVL